MKRFLETLIPETRRKTLRRWLNNLQIVQEYFYDARRFGRHSSALRLPATQGQLAAHLTMDYHRLEKGLALPAPRLGFGQDVIARIITNLDSYTARFGADTLVQTTRGVLSIYQDKQGAMGHQNPALDDFLNRPAPTDPMPANSCGVVPVALTELFPSDEGDVFLQSRRSVRQFTGDLIPDETLQKIAVMAQRAPSVCNRQSGRLYVANTPDKMKKALSFQNGNRGFGQTLGAVIIVTADVQAFTSLGERNQGFVDGGIFAQQTLLAIHALKLGGCMLNWSATSGRDKALRKAMNIPDTQVIITMIGCGVPVADPSVAASPRIAATDVLQML